MGVFFRDFQHLLPDAVAWRIRDASEPWFVGDGSVVGEPDLLIGSSIEGPTIDRFFNGLTFSFAEARSFVDLVWLDIFPDQTRELAAWENQFGLTAADTDSARRAAIDAAWKSTGGQSPGYLQGVLQAAGFDVYIHDWFSSGPPFVPRDPRAHTNVPVLGTVQCGEPLALCGEETAVNNAFLAKETNYIVNDLLDMQAPPPVPDDPAKWPFFLYWGAPTFPDRATVLESRRDEFEQLLLKLCPTQNWLVTLVDYV